MADILIRGMDKPFNCFACDLSHLRGERLFCCVTKGEVIRSKIASDCPIHELPPHGDLIDRVAFRAEMDTHYPFGRGTQRRHGEADAAKSTVINMLANAPVIVPANKEETE